MNVSEQLHFRFCSLGFVKHKSETIIRKYFV